MHDIIPLDAIRASKSWSVKEELAKILSEEGLSPRQLTQNVSGLNYSAVYNILKGKTKYPQRSTLKLIADGLGRSLRIDSNGEIHFEKKLTIHRDGMGWFGIQIRLISDKGGYLVYVEVREGITSKMAERLNGQKWEVVDAGVAGLHLERVTDD